MQERPILFSAPMVRALLAGTKTQTRRAIKPQPYIDEMSNFHWNGWNYGQSVYGVPHSQALASPLPQSRTKRVLCPYGKPGDRLWVRETFQIVSNYHADCRDQKPKFEDGRPTLRCDDPDYPYWEQCYYAATEACPELISVQTDDIEQKWRPSIHMPRWASRITLEITDVRVQRLQDVSEVDAEAEGVHTITIGSGYPRKFSAFPLTWGEVAEGDHRARESAVEAFRDLWESINGAGAWDANPWVWALTFRRVACAT